MAVSVITIEEKEGKILWLYFGKCPPFFLFIEKVFILFIYPPIIIFRLYEHLLLLMCDECSSREVTLKSLVFRLRACQIRTPVCALIPPIPLLSILTVIATT